MSEIDTVPEPRPAGDEVLSALPPLRRPNLNGDLDSVLEFMPAFRSAVRGYERSRVDSYVAWAERELRATRRAADELAARFGACAAELDRARADLARSEAGRQARQVSDRVGQILELAADEAAEVRAAAAAEAEELVAGAREYVTAMLSHARQLEDAAAVAAADAGRRRQEAAAQLAATTAEVQQIRTSAATEVARLAQEAAAVRDRLDAESAARRTEAEEKARRQREQEAAAAAATLAAARRELEELTRRRDRAAESLGQLTDRVGEALTALASGLPVDVPQLAAATNGAHARNEVAQPNVVAPSAGRPEPARHSRWWAGRPSS